MGKQGLGEMNKNCEMFGNFCRMNDLVIGGTIFPHCPMHKINWRSPDLGTGNQTDHITIWCKWKLTSEDVRIRNGADAGMDHALVLTILKIKIRTKIRTKQLRCPHYKTTKLKQITQ